MGAELLLKNFETIADAPDGVERLRRLVLELAIGGRLVRQDPDDESARPVLDRIRAERDANRRRSTELGPIPLNAQPFDLPESWCWAHFGEIFECRLGKMLDKSKNKGTLRPYLRNANVRWHSFDLDGLLEMRVKDSELDDVVACTGDLIICEGGEPGRCAVWTAAEPIVVQKALHRARPLGGVDPFFYARHLDADCRSGRADSGFTGATIKHFTGQMLERHLVAVPPLAEQRRIVAKVDELMALCRELETKQEHRRDLRARFAEAVVATV